MPQEAPWTQWRTEGSVPCCFDEGAAPERAERLLGYFGSQFFTPVSRPLNELRHPVLKAWKQNSLASFIELSSLASDMKAVENVPGFGEVVRDLRDSARYAPTRHALRWAANLARAEGTQLIQFFSQTGRRTPDFEISVRGLGAFCEAKLLAPSENQDRFAQYALQLERHLKASVLGKDRIYPKLLIVVKDVRRLPALTNVSGAVVEAVAAFSGAEVEVRRETFNVFATAPPYGADAVFYRSLEVLCPKSHKEDERASQLGKDASKQLSVDPVKGFPGLLFLGVGNTQSPKEVCDLFTRRFSAGQFSGISGLILTKSSINIGSPAHSAVDQYCAVLNPRGCRSMVPISFESDGCFEPLNLGAEVQIPVYGRSGVEAKFLKPGDRLVLFSPTPLEPRHLE